MKSTQKLQNAGQSLWLDNITRNLITGGGLQQYINDYSVTGLTSNPTIFDHAITNSSDYDMSIRQKSGAGKSGEELFLELALEDCTAAADLFRPIHDKTNGVDGWASIEVSPKLAYDTSSTVAAARELYRQGGRPNLFIKIPGTPEGIPAIEQSIFAGIPINVTLLFSREQYLAAADAYIRAIERRVAAGLNPHVPSVASLFVSRWDVSVNKKVPEALHNRIGIAIARRTYRAYLELLNSDRWLRLLNFGARPQRLLWASTGTKDPKASDVLYIGSLAAPHTINTMPENTLAAFSDHGKVGRMLPHKGGNAEQELAEFVRAGIDLDATAGELQREGAAAFVKSWNELLSSIEEKAAQLKRAS